MKLYRCGNCGGEFERDKPGCDTCEIDPVKEPRFRDKVVELVTIHLDPPHPKVASAGLGYAACDPKLRVGTGPRFTGDPSVVNCAKCKASAAFQAAAEIPPVMPALPVGPRAAATQQYPTPVPAAG